MADRLEFARSRLEERFLDGGTVLSEALQTIGDLIGAVDNVTSALGEDTVDATVADLTATGSQLLALPEVHARRQEGMVRLAEAGAQLSGDVDALLETLRYLRTFAVTVKITGAGIPAFASFADEMLDRIEVGRREVEAFAGRLRDMREGVGGAVTLERDLATQYDGIVPEVTRDLSRDATRMGTYHGEVRRVAAELAELARQIQGKVAKALSALQIGDMTRQRVEHVQAGIGLLTSADEGLAASGRAAVLALLAGQMDDLLNEFHAGGATVTSSLGALAADAKQIVALGRQVRGGSEGGGGGFLRALEESVHAARGLVGRIEAAGILADQISQTSASTASALIESVDTIRAIRSEIQYMAINTSLRCSRLGEAGKPMNVVASELRLFTEQMECVSGRLLSGLTRLSEAASGLLADGANLPPALGEGLDSALDKIKQAGARMGEDLKDLSARGDRVAHGIGRGVDRLDFTRELGEVLEECALALAEAASDAAGQDAGDSAEAAALAQRLFSTYTMARERQVHHAYFPPLAEEEAATPAAASAKDEFDDVLF